MYARARFIFLYMSYLDQSARPQTFMHQSVRKNKKLKSFMHNIDVYICSCVYICECARSVNIYIYIYIYNIYIYILSRAGDSETRDIANRPHLPMISMARL